MRLSRFALLVTALMGLALFASSASCGSSSSKFGSKGGGSAGSSGTGTGTDATLCLSGSCTGSGGTAGSGGTSGSDGGDAGPICVGCKPDPCLAMGMPATSITGYVYDPAGVLPLYGVYVYVPSSMPDPIDPGNPACTTCEAPASGGPIIGTLTDEHGFFNLQEGVSGSYGVPSGADVPLVIQTGKWRKQITLPMVTACGTTAIPDTATGIAKLLRLPANSSEGDMPLIAFTSGCDPAECFLRHIGISDSEFVAPNTPMPPAYPGTTPGAGHVHFFTGMNTQNGMGSASAVAGGNTPADTYAWWKSAANLEQYDIIFNACECNPNDRGATSYAAMDSYLNAGGRLFTTHYYYNWFAPSPPASADLTSVAGWNPHQSMGNGNTPETDSIDQTFPKGKAFATWLQDNAITTTLGTISLVDTRDDVNSLLPAGCEATQSCLSTQWIYNPTEKHPRYISFNTPVAAPVAKQCGKAVFSDVHLSGTSHNETFPQECTDPQEDPGSAHATNEKALEFLFFDLGSCVQNNYQPPVPPADAGLPIPK